MSNSLLNQARIDQSRALHRSLQNEIGEWLKLRRAHDTLNQYFSQLNALDHALNGPLKGIGAALSAISDSDPASTVYRDCKLQDNRLVFVRRFFDYFRGKFDQRDDDRYKEMLAAADEVVWSCYAEPFQRANAPRLPAPLPYVEALFAPEAFVRDRPPPDLQANRTDKLLFEFLKQLPVPIVALPPLCLSAPWWLALLAHETGHHLQFDLVPGWGLVADFRDRVETFASQALKDSGEAARWSNWSGEIFADAVSVCALGEAGVRAIVEFELADDGAMLNRDRSPGLYPSPLARLDLLCHLAQELGLATGHATGAFDTQQVLDRLAAAQPDGDSEALRAARRDLSLTGPLAAAICGYDFAGLGTLRRLYGWVKPDGTPGDNAPVFAPGKTLRQWTDELKGQGAPVVEKSTRAPRLLAAAALRAWSELVEETPEAGRDTALDGLRKRFLLVVRERREETTRAASPVRQPNLDQLGQDLTRLMLDTLNTAEA